MNIIKATLCTFLYLTLCSESYNILHLHPFGTKSHKIVFDQVINELADNGHTVTVFTSYKTAKPSKNIREIITDLPAMHDPQFGKELFDKVDSHPLKDSLFLPYILNPACESFVTNIELKKLLKREEQFDVVIVSTLLNDCALAFAPLLGKNIIMQSPCGLVPWSPSFVPRPPSYVPNFFLPYTDKMTFFERVDNTITTWVARLLQDYYVIPSLQKIINKHVPGGPSIFEAERKISFTITNTDPVLTIPRPTMANIVYAGGIHCRKGEKLPQKLEEFANSSGEDGFIVVSFGSVAQSQYLPESFKKSFITAFSKLKQKVLWKYEGKLDNLPTNVKITKWLPQQDVLAHKNIKLFVTHGGLLGLQESVYHGVPIVAIPLFADQPGNVARLEAIGIGKKLSFTTITPEVVYETINEVISDKKYRENVKKYSAIFRDQPQIPKKKALFWIEYVIQHDGAKHFRSLGEDLNIFQYFLLDVIAFLGFAAFAVIITLLLTIKLIAKKLRNKTKISVGKKKQ